MNGENIIQVWNDEDEYSEEDEEVKEYDTKNRFHLCCCELFNRRIHGFDSELSDPHVLYHYLINATFNMNEFYNAYYGINNYCNNISRYYKRFIAIQPDYYIHHPVQNYKNLIKSIHGKKYVVPEIVEKITLKGGEKVAVFKTFWLRLIQRTWKRIFLEKQRVLQERKKMKSIRYRELHSSWPNVNPTLRGMLSYLPIKKHSDSIYPILSYT